eukprot:6490836-Amphidinium_carterae.3
MEVGWRNLWCFLGSHAVDQLSSWRVDWDGNSCQVLGCLVLIGRIVSMALLWADVVLIYITSTLEL